MQTIFPSLSYSKGWRCIPSLLSWISSDHSALTLPSPVPVPSHPVPPCQSELVAEVERERMWKSVMDAVLAAQKEREEEEEECAKKTKAAREAELAGLRSLVAAAELKLEEDKAAGEKQRRTTGTVMS